MDTVQTRPEQADTHHWLSRFAMRQMALCQDLSFRTAVARAISVHSHAKDLVPEDAAEIDVEVRRCVPQERFHCSSMMGGLPG